uniref:Uncharacterized protein n=1 Tax=Sphaerodactylus townsendi TaxID=933632 RepID=A0ACB8G9F2_9SAUR
MPLDSCSHARRSICKEVPVMLLPLCGSDSDQSGRKYKADDNLKSLILCDMQVGLGILGSPDIHLSPLYTAYSNWFESGFIFIASGKELGFLNGSQIVLFSSCFKNWFDQNRCMPRLSQ